MQLRSGRRLVTPPQQGGARPGRPRRRTTDDGGDGVDRISGLPDELLLDVLARLGCVREAARTSVLARGWRRLWTHLPGNLSFHVADPADPANGARVLFHRNHRDVFISVGTKIAAPSLTSVLRVAAQIEPAGLQVMMLRDGVSGVPFELPCFERAAWIEMSIYNQLSFTLPLAGVFASLDYLNLWFCTADVGDLLARCPRLRRLELFGSWRVNTLAVHSSSLEELMLGIHETPGDRTLRHVDIVTPMLRKFERQWCGPEEFTMSYNMPVVEEISIPDCGPSSPVGLGQKWRLDSLTFFLFFEQIDSLTMGTACVNKHEQPVRVLSLKILCDRHSPAKRSFTQEIARLLGGIDFSTLELKLGKQGHDFGALVFELLQIPAIQRLKVVLLRGWALKCSENCDCNQVGNWRNQHISLTNLEVAVIEGFRGVYHEIDFLELLFRSAPMLKRVTVQLSVEVSLLNGLLLQELQAILQRNTSVECDVYDNCDKKISFA